VNTASYTAIFGSTDAPKKTDADSQSGQSGQSGEPADLSGLKRPVMIGGTVLLLALGGAFVFKKIKQRR